MLVFLFCYDHHVILASRALFLIQRLAKERGDVEGNYCIYSGESVSPDRLIRRDLHQSNCLRKGLLLASRGSNRVAPEITED